MMLVEEFQKTLPIQCRPINGRRTQMIHVLMQSQVIKRLYSAFSIT